MIDFVYLYWKRNRGWPWPEWSWGLSSLFGENGWCRGCGVPRHAQSGPLTLQRTDLTVAGAWVPNWQFDVICMERSLAEQAAARFDLDLRPVGWPRSSSGDAMQIVIPTVGQSWFDPAELHAEAIKRHGLAGATCRMCGVWRWMPLVFGVLPPLRISSAELGSHGAVASREWFGDGMKTFRQVLVRRGLAELLAKASPRDFKVVEVELGHGHQKHSEEPR